MDPQQNALQIIRDLLPNLPVDPSMGQDNTLLVYIGDISQGYTPLNLLLSGDINQTAPGVWHISVGDTQMNCNDLMCVTHFLSQYLIRGVYIGVLTPETTYFEM